MNMLLQDVLSFLLDGAVVGPKQSLSVSVDTDGTCFCTVNVDTKSRTWPVLAFLAVGSTSWVPVTSRPLLQLVGDGLFAHLLLWGLWQQLESCFSEHCTLPRTCCWGLRQQKQGLLSLWGFYSIALRCSASGAVRLTRVTSALELLRPQGCAETLACELMSDGILGAVGYSQGQAPSWQTTWLTSSTAWMPPSQVVQWACEACSASSIGWDPSTLLSAGAPQESLKCFLQCPIDTVCHGYIPKKKRDGRGLH